MDVVSIEVPEQEAEFREVEFLESEGNSADEKNNESNDALSGTGHLDLPCGKESDDMNVFPDLSLSDSAVDSAEEPAENKFQQKTITVKLPAADYKKYQFHFIGVFYARLFRTQHMQDYVYKRDVYGSTLAELHQCIWENSKKFVSREIMVSSVEAEKHVGWATKQTPDVTDIGKYILLKHGKTKKLHTLDDLSENSKLLSKWRGSEVQVHIFKHSVAITSHTLWEMVSKKLLHPEAKDKAGAPAVEEIFHCIKGLKESHSHYTALYASWEKWANYILAQPGDVRPKLMKEAPPDDYLHLFRAAPLSEASQLQSTRIGLQVAYNINESFSSTIDIVCERFDSLVLSVSDIQVQIHELKAQVRTSRSLLDAMKASLPPEENEFSRRLASNVTDAIDIDHQM